MKPVHVEITDRWISNRNEVILEGVVIEGERRVEFGALTDGNTIDWRVDLNELTPEQYEAIHQEVKKCWNECSPQFEKDFQ